MKTLKKFILSLLVLIGWVAIFTVLKSFTPDWVYYSVFVIAIILVLYDFSRTKKTYWKIYYVGEEVTGNCAFETDDEFFPIIRAEKLLNEEVSEPVCIVSCIQISKNDYKKLIDEKSSN
ncbi:MAG: hypothetical protein AB7D38_12460 [Sulfurimonas sp.]|uniref:hypothetical protein n=1 Tax=Sulfurimonas sp. TaxID=2022749 RepID=UPI003D152169